MGQECLPTGTGTDVLRLSPQRYDGPRIYLPSGTDGGKNIRRITNLYKLFPARSAHILQLGHKQLLGCQPHLDNIPGKEPEKYKRRFGRLGKLNYL